MQDPLHSVPGILRAQSGNWGAPRRAANFTSGDRGQDRASLLRFLGQDLSGNRPLRGFRRTGIVSISRGRVGGLYACDAGMPWADLEVVVLRHANWVHKVGLGRVEGVANLVLWSASSRGVDLQEQFLLLLRWQASDSLK
jgi:hypothetical protein